MGGSTDGVYLVRLQKIIKKGEKPHYKKLCTLKVMTEEKLKELGPEMESKRRERLSNEVECLKNAHKDTSIYLMECLRSQDRTCTYIITDLVYGYDLWKIQEIKQ